MQRDPLEMVASLTTVEACETVERHARERGRHDVAVAARKKAIALLARSKGSTSEVERECLEAIYAYEQVLTAKNKRKTTASRTWPMVEQYGIIAAVERVVCRDSETAGYQALAEMGLKEYAFEAVILRHPAHFSSDAIRNSKNRLQSSD